MEEGSLGRGKIQSKRGMEVVRAGSSRDREKWVARKHIWDVGWMGFRSGDRGKETLRCLADLGSWMEGGACVEMKGQLDDLPKIT